MVLATFINRHVQVFYRDLYVPQDGYFEPPAGPGFGYELDEAKIKNRVELP
jgi:L-alanine-DL-glutamate epimerase-like enolase superfamily enzyme